jgi:predicted RNA binding protein YcfA (HicA-like mRNA interferase family)
MKRNDLLQLIAEAARERGIGWEFVREGGDHEIWTLDGQRVAIPRHREVHELTAGRIIKELESRLGKQWWRR